ncbi:hypothetical protein QBC46DRAFT_370566 [Diplogelasinospora grovesii]|uniref:Nuclear pore complex protein Nup85 n=1 Tax=Diplogelasinospora grovesii TaxID=303347 RepID=A0AAN6SAG8_9PEZI|nr:hypothetical protein QBC46DRAFT_370566 [Diplogelasinospora grovesii]
MWLDMPQENQQGIGDESDLMMMATPAATERVRREAEDIYRASAFHQSGARRREHKFAALAKDLYNQMGTAPITEPPQLILGTEAMITRLYDDGVGEADDAEKLDETLATVAGKVAKLWQGHVDRLPRSNEEHMAEIGPGPHASDFEKANYLANLALQVHHARYDAGGQLRPEPLPETLFRWLGENHNLYGSQMEDVLRHRPSPACHSLFWQTVFVSLLRGRVGDATRLLAEAGWGHVRRGQRGEYAYRDRALENVQRAVEGTIDMLQDCPGIEDSWDIWNSDWTLFRVRAQGALDQLRRFAEGRDNALGESMASSFAASQSRFGQSSMAGLARRAESQVPWEIYENLNVVFDIVLGQQSAILDAAQDWCEATIGLFGWWNEKAQNDKTQKTNFALSLNRSTATMAWAQSNMHPGSGGTVEGYLDRLAHSFHTAVESDFAFNSMNPVEIGMACVFEDNAKAVIGILRGWSLPISAAVAEIASLGKWLPAHQPPPATSGGGGGGGLFGFGDDLDMDDLELLGMNNPNPFGGNGGGAGLSPDEVDGIKDSTLVQYAQALADYEELSTIKDANRRRDGWELAIHVLGRMDSPERSEEMVGELAKHLLEGLHVDSASMVDKIWVLLNELGMIPFAEEAAETYGEILSTSSHRYGEAMWYYALAHRPAKVREVMNLLISYSLIQSTAFPPAHDLDDHLHRLLTDREQTLKQLSKQDLEAAELLGKMLSGYASLRQFYEIRDTSGDKKQAAQALVSVIASSDDNIRGGLYDASRDGIVSEDFLLALLGETLPFVTSIEEGGVNGDGDGGVVLNTDQIDTLLKAVEDLQAVGSRVYGAAEDFLGLVLAATPGGLKGSTPADLLKSTAQGGSMVLAGTSMLASQLHKSLGAGGGGGGGWMKVSGNVKRGWDWRKTLNVGAKGEEILRRLRVGIAKDLAKLWLVEADASVW